MPRKKIVNPVTLFYPNKLSVNGLKSEVVNYHPIDVKARDYYLFFHLLADAYLTLENRDSKFLPLHCSIVQDVLGRHYASIIRVLVKYEYILVNDYYCEHRGIPKSYALHPRLMDDAQPMATYHTAYDKVLHNKLERIGTTILSSVSEGAVEWESGRAHVVDKVFELMLVPDAAAMAYVQAQYTAVNNPNPPEAYFHYWNYNPLRENRVDAFGGRLHNLITNMPKALRRCLRFKSDPDMVTVERDIVNAQPFFLSAISAALVDTFVPECASAVPVYRRYENEKDYIQFNALCAEGTVYEYFGERYFMVYGNHYANGLVERRSITKKLIYGVFYSDYSQIEKGLLSKSLTAESAIKKKFFQLFKDEFPSVYALFKDLKSLYWPFTVNKHNVHKQYANNCLLAQRLESSIMYECVIPQMIAGGIVDVVTVHDCCIVKQCDAESAVAIMNRTFAQLGLHPNIK